MRLIPGLQRNIEGQIMLQAARLNDLNESVFSVYSREAARLGAINLAQGFPNFPGPLDLIVSLKESLDGCMNQYSRSRGEPELVSALSAFYSQRTEIESPPEDFLVTAGATEGLFAVILGLVNPGDRVLCFEPFYESYRQSVVTAGGQFVTVPLLQPQDSGWSIDWSAFAAAASLPFKLILLNSPHNPTGLVLNHEDFQKILVYDRKFDAAVVCDEVYENLVFDNHSHVSLIEAAQARDRVVSISSVAKSFGFTGFKLGWIHGRKEILDAALKVHEAAVFCVPMHIQLGFARFLQQTAAVDNHLTTQQKNYAALRLQLETGLSNSGFEVCGSIGGAYFVTASARKVAKKDESDKDFAWRLMREAQVAALPISAFCVGLASTPALHPAVSQHWLRFSFCKTPETLSSALENLSRWSSSLRLES